MLLNYVFKDDKNDESMIVFLLNALIASAGTYWPTKTAPWDPTEEDPKWPTNSKVWTKPTDDEPQQISHGLNSGQIAAISIGSVAAVGCVIAGGIFAKRKYDQKYAESALCPDPLV